MRGKSPARNGPVLKKALVTGATGFVGSNVARALLERGRSVRVLVRASSDRSNLAGLDLEYVIGDLRNGAAVQDAVRGCDEVYHVGAEYTFWSKNPEEVIASNVEGTRNVMDACLDANVERVVYTSTVGTIGLGGDAPPEVPRDEKSPAAPGQFTGTYKSSKLEAEEVALDYIARGLPLVVVNPSAPVGPWDRKPTPTGKIIVDFMRGNMPAFLDTGLNIVHVHDVAVGHVLAAERGTIGERYILGNRDMSLAEILRTLATITGRRAPRIRIPYAVAWLAGFASTTLSDHVTGRAPGIPLEAVKMSRFHMYFSAAKAVRELGLPQTPPEKALGDAVEWFSSHGHFRSTDSSDRQNTNGQKTWQYP